MNYLVKEFIPPLAHRVKYHWKGDYKDYQTAKEKCQGYDEADILNHPFDTKVPSGKSKNILYLPASYI